MSGAAATLVIIALVLGVVVLGVVVVLLAHVLQPIREIERYSARILDGGLGIARNLDGLDEGARTLELAGALPQITGGKQP